MRRPVIVLIFVASLLPVRSVWAQDAGSIGVTMGYPASVGVFWHVTERVALRPEISFFGSSTDTDALSPSGIDTSADGHTVLVGVSVPLFVAKWDTLRAYVVPRYAYSHTGSSSSSTVPAVDFETKTRGHLGSVSVGAHQMLGQRFAVYGELGWSYERLTTEATSVTVRSRGFGTRSGVGVVVYF